MKKLFAAALLSVAAFSLYAQSTASTFSFNWANPSTLSPAYPAPTEDNRYGEYISNVTFTSGPVTLTVDDDAVLQGSQKARFLYGYLTRTVEMRAYELSNIVVKADAQYSIREITFDESSVRSVPLSYYMGEGTLDGNVWTAYPGDPVNEVVFDVDATTNLILTSVTLIPADEAGVDTVVSDGVAETTRWFTLSGVELARQPSAPGLYLKRRGHTTLKVVVR